MASRPMSACWRQKGAKNFKVFAPNKKSKGYFYRLFHSGSKTMGGMGSSPPAIREAATGIFLWPASGLYDTIKGDEFKDNHFSHDRVPPTSGDLSRGRATTMGPQARPAARIVLILWRIPQNGNEKNDRRESKCSPGGGLTPSFHCKTRS